MRALIHSCSNEHVARAGLNSIGGEFAVRIAAEAARREIDAAATSRNRCAISRAPPTYAFGPPPSTSCTARSSQFSRVCISFSIIASLTQGPQTVGTITSASRGAESGTARLGVDA